MGFTNLRPLITACLLLFFILVQPGSSVAQSASTLGFNPFTNQQYQCVRFTDSSLNFVQIVSNNGKRKNVKIKKARRNLKKNLKRANQRAKTLKRSRKRAKKQLNRLSSGLSALLPKTQKKIKKLREKIEKLDVRIAQNLTDKNILLELIKSIPDCKKDAPLNGSLEVVSGSYKLGASSRFYAALIYRLDRRPDASRVCAEVTGHNTRIPGAGGIYYLDTPFISNLSVRFGNLCLVRVNDDCLVTEPGDVAYFVGIGGVQNPGTCGTATPYRCSLAEAISRLTNHMAQVTVNPLGTTNSATCNQDRNSY